jgi:O-antigen/teichoic acid export membrane protein
VSAAGATVAGAGGDKSSRPLLHAVDKSDAALMSVGTLASGVLAYAFNVLAARALGPAAYGAIGALWGGMFLLAVLLFRPIEQTVSRAIADHVARGEDARPAVRSAAWLTALVTTAAVAGCVFAWAPITDRLFGGEPVLTVALVAGLAGYGLSYFARGLAGGVQWFGGYGLVLLADGVIRFVVALPLLIVASQTVAAVAIAAAAAGGAVAPLLSRRRGRLRRIHGDPRSSGGDVGARPSSGGARPSSGAARRDAAGLSGTVRFAAPAAVIAGAEQVLVSGGPLLVLIAGGEGAAAAAGVLFAATLLVRAPVFLLQGVQASLLPSLTTFRARGDEASLHRATVKVAVMLAGFAAALAAGALVAGPFAMELLYGDEFTAGRVDLALLCVGIGGFMAAGAFCQAALARGQAWQAARGWGLGAIAFVALELTLSGSAFHRVSLAFAAGSTIAALLLIRTLWRERT